MSAGAYQAPRDAGTVPVHVQVIDLEPFALDMVVPTYLPARDLTQRVARDAGLGAYWPDGTRRLFWLRARGRLLGDEEKLEDLGVVPYELIHLLPQPPEGSGLEERPPEYPPNKGYAGAGNVALAGSLLAVGIWSLGWSLALSVERGILASLFPAVGLSLVCTSLSRHLWGGLGSQIRIPVLGWSLFVASLALTGLLGSLMGGWLFSADPEAWAETGIALSVAFIAGTMGVLVGWLAWYGAVEPLPKVTLKEVKEAEALVTWPCGICGGTVTPEVKADCGFGCGRVFHKGCYEAKNALGDGSRCAVCGFTPAT